MVTGSDEEQALVNAAKTAFPNSKQLYCMIHCKDNARHYMANAGVSVQIRENVLARLFACNGVAEAGDEVTMDNCISDVMQYLRQSNVDESTTTYKQDRILPAEEERSMVGPASMDKQQQRIHKPSTEDQGQ